jgi:hypothetical protein
MTETLAHRPWQVELTLEASPWLAHPMDGTTTKGRAGLQVMRGGALLHFRNVQDQPVYWSCLPEDKKSSLCPICGKLPPLIITQCVFTSVRPWPLPPATLNLSFKTRINEKT